MLISDKIQINVNPKNKKYYNDKGFKDIKTGDKILVNVNILPIHSRVKIKCKCDNCNDIKEIRNSDYNKITKNGTEKYYCNKCKSLKTKETLQEKYGVDNVFQLNEVKNKIKNTIKEKYGVEHHLQNKECLDKLRKTNKERYGVDYVQKNKQIREKTEKTSELKYGHKTSLLNIDVKNKIKTTLINKYGVDNPLKNELIKKKSDETRINNIKKKYEDLDILDIKGDLYTIKCDNGKEHDFEISSVLLYHRKIKYNTVVCTTCNKINSKNISGLQTEFINFIKDNYNDTILINDRNTIDGELDIYLPEINLAFEFNGVYWHNELYKDKYYHKNKTEKCNDKGIQLLHIYEDDWLYKREIIESIILNKIGITSNRIYARKCNIKEIDNNKLIKDFLEKNHIQGHINSSIKIGLFYGDELVSLMTFGKLRKPLNSKSNGNEYELLRFCNRLNTSVIGGASKLFKYFINNYNYDEIITYADRSYSNGNLYYNLGFDFVKLTVPNYYYIINGIKHNRFSFRKDVLVKQGFDINKSEHDIMLERGYYRLYNSGNYKFIYK